MTSSVRDQLSSFLESIPTKRDDGYRGFVHRVTTPRQFAADGAADELREAYETVAELAGQLGAERPKEWRPGHVADWAAWCDEWKRIAQYIEHVLTREQFGDAGEATSPGASDVTETAPMAPRREDREVLLRAALASLITIGPNAKRIANQIGVPVSTLRSWETFMENYDKAKRAAEHNKNSRRGRALYPTTSRQSARGRTGATDFEAHE